MLPTRALVVCAVIGCALFGCKHETADPQVATKTPGTPTGPAGADKPTRIDVKHGTDADVAKIDRNAKETTIDDIVATKMPSEAKGELGDHQKDRVGPFETTVWKVKATVKSVVKRKDGDFYLIVAGPSGKEGVVEVPDPKLCKGSPFLADITAAREELEKRYHPDEKKKDVGEEATIEGVGFLGWQGKPSGQAGKGSARLMPGTKIDFSKKK